MRSYLKATGLVAGLTFGTNLLGFVREMLFAREFGASSEADVYVTAFSIAALCFLVFSGGALQGAFMPRYQNRLVRGDPLGARALFKAILLPLMLLLCAVTFVLILGAELWVDLVVPGFGPDQKILTKQLLYWLAPMVILVGFGSLFQSIAHAHSHFLLPALVPVLNNVVIIFFLLFVVPSLGILGLVQGTLIGAALWLLLLPLVGRLLPSDKSVAPVKDTDAIRDLFGGMLPLIILLVVDQMSALFQKNIVSDLEPGSIAVLNYAARLEALPVGIFAAAIASVFFPALVDAISREDTLAVDSRFRLGIGAVFFCAVPATIFLMMESRLAVHVLFERGAFDSVATARAADALVLYAAGLAPQCLIVFVNRVYFAAGNTRTPMKIGVLSAVIHVLSCWVFVEYFGYLGIALGTTIYAFVYVLMLFVGLKKVLIVSLMSMLKSIWRSFVGGLVMIIFYFSWSFDHNFWGLLFSIVVGGCVYLIVAFVLREPVLFGRKTLA